MLTQEQFIRTNPSFPDPPHYLSLSDAYSRPPTHPLPKKRYPGDRLYTADFKPDQIRAGCARFFIELNWDWWDTYRPGGWNALGNQLWERVFGDYEDYCEGKKNGELFLVLIDAARVLLHEIIILFAGGEHERAEKKADALLAGGKVGSYLVHMVEYMC